jgi:hypothetical protein
MSLPVLIVLVAVGISLVVAAVHFTGGSKVAVIDDESHARRIFSLDFPDETPTEVMITADRHSAFLSLSGRRVGMVQSFGDGFFTRIATARDIAAIALRGQALSIRFRDFTWTGGFFRFAEDGPAARVAAILGSGDSGEKV